MFEDVFGKLKSLHDEVRTRLEATPDWKALTAVERAMSEVKSLLPNHEEEHQHVSNTEEASVEEAAKPMAAAAEPVVTVAEGNDVGDKDASEEVVGETEPVSSSETSAAESGVSTLVAAEASEDLVVVPEIPEEDKALLEEIVSSGPSGSEGAAANSQV